MGSTQVHVAYDLLIFLVFMTIRNLAVLLVVTYIAFVVSKRISWNLKTELYEHNLKASFIKSNDKHFTHL